MIIHVSDKLRIHGTETGYQIEQPKNRKGQIRWEAFRYYTTFRQALAAACEREIRTYPAEGLTEAIEAAHAVATKYGELLDVALEEFSKRSEPSLRAVS